MTISNIMTAITGDLQKSNLIPFHTFILKIQSRCNLNCDYCFVYNREDTSWKSKPGLISEETIVKTAQRILEHNQFHGKKYTSIIYHGGEPMLGGRNHIEMVTSILKSTLQAEGIDCKFGMQSNGLLFDEKMGDLMLRLGLRTGISIDGPPHVNDRFRVDHKGRGSGQKLHKRLQLLTSPKYKSLLSGFLSVVDLDNDPIEIYEYLKSFNPPSIDFLLPYDNWLRLPYKFDPTGTYNFYADWFIKLFDHWIEDQSPVPIRTFDSMLRIMFGGKSLVESMGVEPVDLVVVETDGAIEAVDSLKAAKNGITDLSLNVFENSFNEAANHSSVIARQLGAKSLAKKCRSCDLVNICGGGYIPTRYSKEKNFNNPSVYCTNHEKLIRHIYNTARSYIN